MKKSKAAAGKPAKPAKPTPLKAQKAPQHVTARKTSSKHAQTAKHKSQKHAAKRGWSPDEAFPWCSARAVCEALGLADPWAIHTLAGGDEDRPVSILAALSVLPGEASFERFSPGELGSAVAQPLINPAAWTESIGSHALILDSLGESRVAPGWREGERRVPGGSPSGSAVQILGVDWPEPHAVVDYGGLWWSWGELYEPWTDQISEAWVIT